jgi:CRISPR/Cas system-associated endonuclease/helicase Cas3
MYVEPAMLLMYKSVENNPSMTDSLVEYLHNYTTKYFEDKQAEFMLSVQRAIKDCEAKGVIKDFRKLINHPKLKPDSQ